MNANSTLKKFKPLSTIDNYVGSATRKAVLNSLPGGGYLNQGYDFGKE
jgi:hypothetical protein